MLPRATRASEPPPSRIQDGGRRFAVALSFPGELRGTASAIARRLAGSLGQHRVFYDHFHQAELARPNLDLHLLEIYHRQSDLVVVFLSRDYEAKDWCGLEWRAVRDLIKSRKSEQIMLLRFDDTEIPGLLSIDGYIDARVRLPKELAGLILERLEERPPPAMLSSQTVDRPGVLRHLLDRAFPRLHLWLTRIGTFPEPPEMADLHAYLGDLKAGIENEVREKTWLPLEARDVPRRAAPEVGGGDPFARPVQQHIRQVLGISEGGDSASAQIAAVNRRSRLVKDILGTLLESDDPLVLLGDPGSGKTMTLQQAAVTLAESELRRVFPSVAVYVRLGELHVEGEVGPEQVFAYAVQQAPERIRPWIDSLGRRGRLVLLFDGMDEMSRERYTEHTEALSVFAGSRRGWTKTLFSCRITDFSPSFIHRRLVVLPFNRAQIMAYLRQVLPGSSLIIDGSAWSLHRLARRLSAGDLPVDPSNPFVLWLLCLFLQEQRSWPASRVDLMRYYNLKNFERKREDAEDGDDPFPEPEEAFTAWGRFAFAITERNRGAAIPVDLLVEGLAHPDAAGQVYRMIRVGKSCGVLTESIEGTQYQIRFSHHRFQEYFTACHIQEANPPVDWLGKLDAPRWQETMVNLVLMGGAEDGVGVLADAIDEPVYHYEPVFEQHKEKKRQWEERKANIPIREIEPIAPKIPDEEESILADRIELGAKLIRHGERTSQAVQERLRPALRQAVDLLAEWGNPITQVKMMRACQHSTDLDLLKALEKPLRSRVRWVRDQALILVAAGGPGSRIGGANLPAQMGFDLGRSAFLFRWLAYLKAVLASRQKGAWWSFSLATLVGLLGIVLFLGESVLVYEIFSYAPLFDFFRIPPEVGTLLSLTGVQIGIASLVLVLILLIRGANGTSYLWAWFPIGTFLAIMAFLTGQGLLRGNLKALFLVILAAAGAGILYLLLALPVALVHSSLLGLYLVLTRWARGPGQDAFSFLALAWRECGFVDAAEILLYLLRRAVRGLAWMLLLAGAGLGVYALSTLSPLFLAVLFVTLVSVGLLLSRFTYGRKAAIRAREWLGAGTAKIGEKLRPKTWISELWKLIAAVLCGGMIGWGFTFLKPFFISLGSWVARGLGLALALLAAFLLYRVLSQVAHLLRLTFPGGAYPPSTFTREQWMTRFRVAKPGGQQDLLLRTDHQSLGLQVDEFLEVLREAAEHVKGEPALSVYWDRRDQLEQALRQERQG